MSLHNPNLSVVISLTFVGLAVNWNPGAIAQIIPDQTLGTEHSHVNRNVDIRGGRGDRIDGGALRGVNLFHSFQEFNVNPGQRVYFNNPTGVENILSRVTGTNVSNIDGTLGVDGTANLFLLNPNGIILGPNARLDVSGSFVASTADRFTFPDGSEFSATQPQAPPLLNINVPLGLQYGTPQGNLLNEATLVVQSGKSLVLQGNLVEVKGSLIAPAGIVQVLGDRVALLDTAHIDVSSETGGGTALIGGDYQGQGSVPTARRTYVAPTATINADAILNGNGGRVIVWADEATGFYGDISARGGSQAGDGGFVEVSGWQTLNFAGAVDTSAPLGQIGTLLLDPTNINVVAGATPNPANAADGVWAIGEDTGGTQTIGAGAIATLLGTTDLTLQASNTINVNAPINYNGGTARNLVLRGDTAINVNANISINGNLTLNGGGTIQLDNAITTTGNQTYGDVVSVTNPIQLNAGTGTIAFNNTLSTANHDLTLLANEINFGDTVSGTGTLTLQPSNTTQAIAIGAAANNTAALDLTDTELGRLQTGFSGITIGRADSTGSVTLNAVTFTDPVAIAGGSTLIGADQPTTWTITGGNSGTLSDFGAAVNFSNIEGLVGNDSADTFSLTSGTFSGSIIGGGGDDLVLFNGGTTNGTIDGGSGALTLQGDEINLTGTVSGTGNLLIQPTTPFQAIALGNTTDSGANTLDLLDSDLSQLQTDFSAITIGRGDGTGVIRIPSAVSFDSSVTLLSPGVGGAIQVSGSITVPDITSVTLQASEIDLNGGSITARAGEVNLLGTTINLNAESVIDVSGQPSGSKPATSGGTVRIGNSPITDNLPANAAFIFIDQNATINAARGNDNGNGGEIRIRSDFTAIPPQIVPPETDPSLPNLSVGGDGTLDINGSNQPPNLQFFNITIVNGSTIILDGNSYSALALDEINQTLLLTETFAETLNGFELQAFNDFTIQDLISDGALTYGAGTGAVRFRAGRLFHMVDDGDTIRTNGNDVAITAGSMLLGNIDTSLPNSRGGNIDLIATGDITLTNSQITSTNGGSGFSRIWIESTGGAVRLNNAIINAANPENFQGTGFAGDILLNGATTVQISNSSISTNGNQGRILVGFSRIDTTDLTIETPVPQLIEIQDSSLTTSNANISGVAPAGSIDILATISPATSLTPQNRGIAITNSQLATNTVGSGVGGLINLNAGTLVLANSSLNAGTSGSGNGGSIAVKTNAIILQRGSEINAGTSGRGDGGSITVRADAITLQDGSAIAVDTTGIEDAGDGGNILMGAATLNLFNSSLNARTLGAGNGGSIRVRLSSSISSLLDNQLVTATVADLLPTDANRFTASNGVINTQTNGAGRGSNIDIIAGSIDLSNNSALNASVLSSGAGGDITVTTPTQGTVILDNSQISTAIEERSTGVGEDIGGDIVVTTGVLDLLHGGRIQSQTSGPGAAGDIQINVETRLTASGVNPFGYFSGILTSSETATSGVGGDIIINSDGDGNGNLIPRPRGVLTLFDRAFLAASTRSGSSGGNIQVNVATLNLLNTADPTRSGGQILTAALVGSSGNAGEIIINATDSVTIAGKGTESPILSPFTTLTVTPLNNLTFQTVNSPASGGFAYYSFNVAAANSLGTFDVDGGYKIGSFPFFFPLSNSIDTQLFLFDRATGSLLADNDDSGADPGSALSFFSGVTPDAFLEYTFPSAGEYVIGVGSYPSSAFSGAPITGTAPEIGQTYTLNVALTAPGTGGTVNPIQPNPNLGLNSGLFASSQGTGIAGSVTINTPILNVQNGGEISVETSGTGDAGLITLQPYGSGSTLTIDVAGGDISASTSGLDAGSGVGGSLRIVAPTSVTIQGDGTLAAETRGAGRAGSITIDTPTLTISGGARVSATATAAATTSEQGGGVTVNANTIHLSGRTSSNRSSGLFAETLGRANASNLTLRPYASNPTLDIRFQDGAKISASTSGSGTGGNFSILAPNAVTVDGDGSLTAETSGVGRAGSITIATPDLFVTGGAVVSATATETATASEQGGGVTVTANTINLAGRTSAGRSSGLLAQTLGVANASNLTLQPYASYPTLTISFQDGAEISASTSGRGSGGNFSILAPNAVTVGGDGSLTAETSGVGRAGSITIATPDLFITGGAIVSATATETATASEQGGGVTVTANTINLAGRTSAGRSSGLLAQTLGVANASNLTLQPYGTNPELRIRFQDGTQISASTSGGGTGGNFSILAPNSITIDGDGSLTAETSGSGRAGNIDIRTPILTLDQGARVSATATATATTTAEPRGSLTVNANTINLLGGQRGDRESSGLFAETRGAANAGSLSLRTYDNSPVLAINFQNGAQISASTFGQGVGGNLTVSAPDAIAIQGNGQLSAQGNQGGRAGNLEIGTQQLTVTNSLIIASTDRGIAGNITIDADRSIALDGTFRDVNGIERGGVLAEATAGGEAGRITITTPDLRIANNAVVGVSSRNGVGIAGDVRITANRVDLQNGAQITAETDGGGAVSPANILFQGVSSLRAIDSVISSSTNQGVAGSLSINDRGTPAASVFLSRERSQGESGLFARATGSGGAAGGITANASRVIVQNGAQISASNVSAPTGGDITLNNLAALTVNTNGTISASTDSGQAGNLRVFMQPGGRITLNRGSLQSAAIAGGNAGNVVIRNAAQLHLDRSRISVSSTSAGRGGDLTVAAQQIRLRNRSAITAETEAGEGGNLRLVGANGLQLYGRSEISTSTQRGRAGDLSILMNGGGAIALNGNSRIAAEATSGATPAVRRTVPIAGNLRILTDRLQVQDRSAITVSSPNGQAGSLTIDARSIQLNNGRLSAETGFTPANQVDGGANIFVRSQETSIRFMQNNSVISARALRNADGGNLTIDLEEYFLLSRPGQNNDIIATAEGGTGGNITVQAQQIFGFIDRTSELLTFDQLRANTTSDISASSEFGSSGTIALNVVNVDPTQGLAELPSGVIDASTQIAQGCGGQGGNRSLGEFTIPGRGGLSANPLDPLNSNAVLTNLVNLVSNPSSSDSSPGTGSLPSSSLTANPHPFMEAQGWIEVGGVVQLVADARSVIPQLPGIPSLTCQATHSSGDGTIAASTGTQGRAR